MNDPTAFLDIERRTGIKNQEVLDWVKKTNAVSNAIRKLASGRVDPKDIDLSRYGILTPEQEKIEKERKRRVRLQLDKKEEEEKKRIKKIEKEKWWKGASCLLFRQQKDMYPANEEKIKHSIPCKQHIIEKYSSDYSRWAESNYMPDDIATKEEIAEKNKIKELAEMNTFEKNNPDFCASMTKDIENRQKTQKENMAKSVLKRVKGNELFRNKKYEKAIKIYKEAMTHDSYNVKLLTNIALCYAKMQEYNDALEFCSRVCHIDSGSTYSTKAIFQRIKIMIHLKSPSDQILSDFKKCLENDERNQEILALHNWYIGDIGVQQKEDELHNLIQSLPRIKNAIIENQNNTILSDSNGKVSKFTDRLHIIVDALNPDLTNPKECTKNIIYAIDLLMNQINQHGSSSILESFKPLGNVWNKDMSPSLGSFLIEILNGSDLGKVYFRTSGYLANICKKAANMKRLVKSQNEKENCRSRNQLICELLSLIKILNVAIICDQRAEKVAIENNINEEFIWDLIIDAGSFFSNDVKCSVCVLLHTFLKEAEEDCTCTEKFGCILGDYQVTRSIGILLHIFVEDWRRMNSNDLANQTKQCIKLLVRLSSSDKLRISLSKSYDKYCAKNLKCVVEESNHPIACVIVILLLLLKNNETPSSKASAELKDVKCSLIDYLMNLSAIEKFRSFFSKQLYVNLEGHSSSKTPTVVVVLLALVKSFKSEGEDCRVSALTVLTNATVESDKSVQQAIVECDGISILIGLMTSKNRKMSSLQVRNKASKLICRCITHFQLGMEALMRKECLDEIIVMITEITLDSKFNLEDGSKTVSAYREDNLVTDDHLKGFICKNLIQLLATIDGSFYSNNKEDNQNSKSFPLVLLKLLPSPQTNSKGVVDKNSVCLPFRYPKENTPCGVAASNVAFFVNVTKVIISCIHFYKGDLAIKLVESFVCLISNYAQLHDLLVRNAASGLAKLVKNNKTCMKRCRELRGMQILLELSQSRKF